MTQIASAVLAGGAAAAFLDGLAATIDFRMRGISFTRLWQGVASGALGPSSFQRGNASVFLGLAFHILIAMTAAFVFTITAMYALSLLLVHYVLFGAVYGIVVFAFMNAVVIPNSAMPPRPFLLAAAIRQIFIHIFFVGLPISLAAHYVTAK